MAAVDVVVVTYNSSEHVRACVEPLARADGIDVLVVDSASSDDTLGRVADLPVATVGLAENRGFGHACNVGWRRGVSPAVLFLNPDARTSATAVETLAAVVRDDPTLGAAGPKIVEADGALDFSIREFPRLRSTYAQAIFLHRVFPRARWTDEVIRDPAEYTTPRSAPWLSGACLLVRREVLEEIDGFDEDFFLYCEDLDLCRRIRDTGLDVRFEPSAVAVHEGGASAPRANLLPVLSRSRVLYAHKHHRPLVAYLEQLGITLGALTHVVFSRRGGAARRGHLRAAVAALQRP